MGYGATQRTAAKLLSFSAVLAFSAGCFYGTQRIELGTTGGMPCREPLGSGFQPVKLRVGVVNFRNLTPRKVADFEQAAAEILTTLLQCSGRFVVIPQQDIDTLLEQQSLGESGAINDALAAQLGGLIGVNAVLTGAITAYDESTEGSDYVIAKHKRQITRVEVNYRIVEVATGRLLLAASGEGEFQKKHGSFLGLGAEAASYDPRLRNMALRDALGKAMEKIIASIEESVWSARIARIDDAHIYINAGLRSGLKKGARLRVLTAGEEIIDPQTQIAIGRTLGEPKGLLEVIGFFGKDGSIALSTLGDDFEVGDIVMLAD